MGTTKPPKDLSCGVPHSAFPFVSRHRGPGRKAAILLSVSQEKAELPQIPHGKDPPPLRCTLNPTAGKHRNTLGGLHSKGVIRVWGTQSQSLGCDTVVDFLTDFQELKSPVFIWPGCSSPVGRFACLFQKGFCHIYVCAICLIVEKKRHTK